VLWNGTPAYGYWCRIAANALAARLRVPISRHSTFGLWNNYRLDNLLRACAFLNNEHAHTFRLTLRKTFRDGAVTPRAYSTLAAGAEHAVTRIDAALAGLTTLRLLMTLAWFHTSHHCCLFLHALYSPVQHLCPYQLAMAAPQETWLTTEKKAAIA